MSFRIIQQQSVALVSDMAPTDQNWWLRALVLGDAYGAIQRKAWGAPPSAVDKLVAAGHVVTDGEWAWLTDFELTQTEKSLKVRPARCSPLPPAEKPGLMALSIDDLDARLDHAATIEHGSAMFVVPDHIAAENVVLPLANAKAQREHDIVEVFEYWAKLEAETGGIQGAKLTPGRRSRINARLDEGYTVEQMKAAAHGYLTDDFYLGKKPGKPKRFTGIDTIFLNGERVEKGEAMAIRLAHAPAADRFSDYDKVGS